MSVPRMTAAIDKRQVRQHFSSHAAEYNRYARIQQRVVERLVVLLEQQPRRLSSGLEVGSGTGLLGTRFRRSFPDPRLVMSDLAHGMSCQSRKVLPDCPVCDADAAALPFAAGSFDYLISSSVYQWVENLPAAFGEVARVLRPDGLFALALFGDRTLHELRTSHRRALSGRPSHGQRFPSLAAVARALGDDFTVEQLFSEDETEWHADVPELLRSLKRIGAQNSSSSRPAGLASRQTMQAMFDCYRTEFGEARGIPATYQVIYLLCRKSDSGVAG
ncbi:MAG: malonyl-ACP O-methyltransferase BioC [Desulfuromonadales bacterium]|nr:malonyl-ACP O-methyltransferase BioC [Desulfuromonadales bacterium]